MNINDDAIQLLKKFEGLRLIAYQDSVGVWTIGYGHTSKAGPPEVKKGMEITAEEAENILKEDLGKYEDAVEKALKREPTPNQFGAMVSLCYNIGPGNFRRSSVVERFNRGEIRGAADAIILWNRAGGRVLRGLVKRRKAERELFLRES